MLPIFFVVNCGLGEEHLNKIGIEVDSALQRYKGRNGSYPISLEKLVPEFLDVDKLPRNFKLSVLNYRLDPQNQRYHFAYDGSLSGIYTWRSEEKKWRRADH